MHTIAIFGGTFDPIHNGHIKASQALQAYFNFDSYIILPCKIPTLKPPSFASNQQRIEMIKLAIKNFKDFKLDLREINRNSPSYMVETLSSFRVEYPEDSITLILGYDAFLSLPHWHQWEKIITLANILVINRTEFSKQPTPEIIQKLLHQYQSNSKTSLLTSKAGTIFIFDAGDYQISSSSIREQIKINNNIKNKLPNEVYEYIKNQGLYQY